MRQYLRISRTVCRIPTCVLIFLVVFSCVIRSGQQETDDPHSFTTLLQVLEGDNVRERRAAEQDDALEGSGPVTPDEDAPVIVVSEQKKFVVKKVDRLSVDVGSTVWAVRGTEITVSCRASSPSGSPTKIEWLRSYGDPVTERFRGGVAAREGTLTIRKLGRFNEGTYTCRASNKAGNTTALFTAKIIIASLPTILKAEGVFSFGPNDKVAEITIGSDVTVYPGTKLTIRCPVEGTGSIVVFWTSQGRPVNIGNAQRVGNDLVITDIDKRYALEYECTARAARGKVSEKSTVRVKDLDPPRIKHGTRDLRFIEEELSEVEIYVGSKLTVISETQITVRCIAAMDPAPAVSWKIQGKDSGFKDDVKLSKDNSSLTIIDPGVEDSGEYACTASNNVGRDSESSIINILPPEPPRIKYSNRKITSLENLDVVEAKIGDELTLLAGANVVITCPTSGLPTPTVKWLKDGEDLSVNGTILTVKDAKTEDSGTFTCEAVNRAGRFSYNSEFRVIAGEKPRIKTSTGRVIGLEGIEQAVVKIGQDLRVVEGLIVHLVCPVRGFPTPEVSWFLNDRMLKTSGRFLVNTRSNSLIVDGIQLQDTGQVSCTASNSAGSAKASSFISIIGESSAQIQFGNSSIESIKRTTKVAIEIGDSLHVLSGSDVSIDCVARGTPRPVINWRWNGREVISRSRGGQYAITDIPNGSRLTVWQMLAENAGQYECIAINTGGGDRIASTITILDATAPEIEISTSSVEQIQNLNPVTVVIGTLVRMLPGGRLEITCRASGIPEPSISFLRQNKQIRSSERFSIVDTTLIIYPTELDDRGSFTCAANNSLGRQTHSTRVDIVEPIKPRITKTGRDMTVELLVRLSEVVGGNILCRDGIDLELTCPVQGLPTPKITWLRGDKRVGTGGRLKLGILREESSGNYSCVATNIAGEARKTTKLNVKSSIPPVIQSSTKEIESYEEDLYLAVEVGTRLDVIQGAKVDIICRVTGFPTPSVNWVKGNSPLTVSFERQGFYIVPYNGTSSTLLIRGFQPPQEDEVYGCTAYNSGGSVTAFSYVTFKERVAPTVLSTWISGSVGVQESLETRDPVTVILGDTARMFTRTKVTIVCEVKAIPVAKVTWTKNGGPIHARHSVNGTNLVLSEQSGISDSGRYACTATNPLGRDSAFSDITFVEPILPTIITGESSVPLLSATNYRATIGSNITTVIGNNITFVCVAEGVPRPDVSWLKGDIDLNVNDTSLVVFASDTTATGVYSCEASNLGGSFTTSSAVTVLDRIAPEKATRPRIITNRENQESVSERRTVEHTVGGNVTILEGRNLLLRCPVEGVPTPSTRWLFNGISVQVSDTLQIDDDTGDLTIIEMTDDDVGEYSCVATNIAGETVEVSYTTVIVPTFPNIDSSNISVEVFDPTRQPVSVKIGSHVTTLTGTPVTITCDATGFPEPKVSWMKGFTSITGSDAQRLILGEKRLSLLSSGVSDSDQYMCIASSPGGQAAVVSNITFVESVKPRILFSTKTREILQRLSLNITIGEKLTILDKSNVTVECSAKGVPPPSLSWSKDGVKLKSLQSNLLHLRNIARKDTGRYTCTAENFLGFVSQSTLLSVRVGRKPFINSKNQGVVVDDKVTDIKLDVGSNLTLVAGSSVTITCEVDAVPEPAITWLQNKNQVLNNVNKTSLTVDNPSRVDLQTVSCTAANVLGSDSKSSYFTILEPSKPRINIHEIPRSIEAQNRRPITLNIGDELTALTETNVIIECPTSGVPRPTVTWTKDGRILRDDGRYTIQMDGSLVIDEANVEDSARYTCNADSVNGQDSASSAVQIVEPVKPVVEVPVYGQDIPLDDVDAVTMNIGDNVTAASNTTITIRCPVSGVPTPAVTWQKDGVQVIEGEKFFMTDDNSLVINNAEIEHSAKYSCIAQNEFGKDEASSTATIIELSKPKIHIPDQPHTIEAQDRSPITFTIGENVTALTRTIITIQCNASGVPIPTVAWTKDDLRIPSGDRYTVEDGGSLLIADSIGGDSARYTCTATSVAGQDSASSTVQIVEPLKPEIEVPKTGREIPVGDGSPVTMNIGDNVTAASNTTITIRCPVSGVPTPAVNWEKDGVQVVERDRINIADDNTLVIKEAELIDSAKYTCIVENSFGKDEISSSVKIIVPSKPVIKIPGKPTTIEAQDRNPITLTIGDNVTALTNTIITIQCPTNGAPIPSVTWTKDDQSNPTGGRYTTKSDGSLLIAGSREDDSAKYTCTAISVAGKESASSTVKIQKPVKPVIDVPEPGSDIPFGDGSTVTMNIGDNVTAASNTTITIRCPVSGVPKPVVTWNKDGLPVGNGGRIKFAQNHSLVIKQVELEDSAKYTCSVQNSFGKDESSSIVTIIEPFKPVINITGTPKIIEAQDQSPIALFIGDNVTALTNTSITIQCSTSGVPTPTVTWTKDGEEVPNDGKYTVKDDGSLLISETDKEDSARYTCTADSVTGRDSASSTVQIIEPTKPLIKVPEYGKEISIRDGSPVTMNVGDNVTAASNTTITIKCPVSGVPTPSATWRKDDVEISEGEKLTILDDNTLVIKEADLEDDSKYTCTIQSPFGKDEVSSIVRIIDPSKPVIKIPDKPAMIEAQDRRPITLRIGDDVTALTNTSITIQCPTSGVPTPTVTWTKDGEQVSNDGRYTVQDDGSLLISGSDEEDSARYTCIADSIIGKDNASSKVQIVEPEKPMIDVPKPGRDIPVGDGSSVTMNIGDNVTAASNTTITIRCPVSGVPTPSATWQKDGVEIREGDKLTVLDDNTLVIKEADLEDDAKYTCTIQNEFGKDEVSSIVRIIDPSKPVIKVSDMPTMIEAQDRRPITLSIGDDVTALTNTSITIQCPTSGVPTPTVTWTKDGEQISNDGRYTVQDDGSLLISRTDEDDSARYTCIADSIIGKDNASSKVQVVEPVKPMIDVSKPGRDIPIGDGISVTMNVGDNVTAASNTTIIIKCPVSGVPTPSATWQKDGVEIREGDKLTVLDDNTLVIKEADLEDDAKYTCTIQSPFGKDEVSSIVRIIDPSKPVIKIPDKPAMIEAQDRRPITLRIGDDVTALTNTSITIQCPTSGVPTPTVTWTKDDEQVSNDGGYTVQDDGSLLISGTAEEDSARYTCIADSIIGKDSASSKVQIVEPVKPVIEVPKPGRDIPVGDGSPVTMNIGDNVTAASNTTITIRCPVSGVPAPAVTWEKDGDLVVDDGGVLVREGDSLVITGAEDNTEYTCKVSNVAGEDSLSSMINIIGPSKPKVNIPGKSKTIEAHDRSPITLIIGDNVTALTNTSITIQCPTSGVPTPTVTWTKDGQDIPDGGKYIVRGDNSLVISEADVEDDARYTCTADSVAGQDSASTEVQIVEPSKPTIEVGGVSGRDIPIGDGSPVTMNVGDSVTAASNTTIIIRCPTSGVPTPTVTWKKDGVQIVEGDWFSITVDNSLVIKGAEVKESAEYTCMVQSAFGKDETSSVVRIIEPSKPVINISGTPRTTEAKDRRPITLIIGDNVTALTNTSITIQCPTSGVPTPTVTWTKDDQSIASGGMYRVQNNDSLLINEADEENSARYTCTADSVAGRDSASSTVQIVKPTKPNIEVPETGREIPIGDSSSVTMNIGDNVTAASNTTITIRCPVSGVPAPFVTWDKDGVLLKDEEKVSVRGDSLLIRGGEVEDSAKYTCRVANVAGMDKLSSIIKIIGQSKPKLDISAIPKTIEAQDRSLIALSIGDNVTALTNTSITIRCPTSGVPTPTVTWTKDGQEIFDGGRYNVQDDGSLLIRGAEKEDSGQYMCTAANVAGKDRATSTVQVVEPTKPMIEVPEIKRDIPVGDGSPVTMNIGDNVTAASNTTITIRCPVSGVPKPSVSWKMDDVQITEGDRFFVTDDNTLIIKRPEVEGSTKYTCSVQSKFGKDNISSHVTILGPSKPVVNIYGTPKTIDAEDRSPIIMAIADNVTALTNTSITIQCPTSGVPTPTVTWTKDDKEITNDGRYTVQDDGSLLISEAYEEDDARYTCTAHSVAGRDSASSTVQIAEPVKPVIEVPKPGREIPVGDGSPVIMNVGDNVTAASNTSITIRCPVSGVPTPDVTWKKNGARVTQGETLFITTDNSLVIKNADVDDSAKYTCSIQSNFGKEDILSVVEIIVHKKPVVQIAEQPKTIKAQDRSPITLVIGDNVTALTNTSITIQCPTSGVPSPTVTWTKDGEQVTSGGRYTVQDDGSLLINEADEQDSDRYTCTAGSVAGKGSASSTVDIVEPIKPMIKVPEPGRDIPVGDGSPVTMNIGDNVTAASNTTITIRCPVSGVPTPSVTWRKDGVPIIAGGNIFLINEKQRLIIRVAKGEDSGKYSCSVESNFGKDSLSSIVRVMGPSTPKLKISEKPKTIEVYDQNPITLTIGDNVTAVINTSITIQCPTSGVPTPTVTWTKNNQQIASDGRYTVHDDGSLLISEASEEDSARYTCTADSVVGKDSSSSMVQIVEPIKPAIDVHKIGLKIPVGNGSPVTMNVGDNVTAALNTTITIRCPVSGVPTPSVTWHKDGVQIFEQDRIKFIADNNSLAIEVAMLVDSAKYTCRVQSVFGMDEVSSQVTIIDPVRPLIASSLGDVTSFSQDQVNITIGQNLLTIIDTKLLIHCEASGVPVPKIAWTRGNETLPSDGRMSAKNGTLVIVEVETSDSGNYTCTADNTAGTASVSSNVTVAVPTPPEIIRTGIKDVQVLEPKSIEAVVGSTVLTISGNNVSISCGVTGFPTPSVEWTRDGVLLETGTSILRLSSLDSDDTGSYMCTATSPLGSFDSQSTNLTVIAIQPPKITTNTENVEVLKIKNISVPVGGLVTTLHGNRVSMVCEVSGIPAPQITWERDGMEVQRGGKVYTIDIARQGDNGNYSCIARNSAGEVNATSKLQILGGSAPNIDASRDSRVHLRIDFFAITIGTNLTTLASSGLEISCPVTGFPKPSIQWYREGVPVEPGMMLNVDEDTGTLFTLSISHRKGGEFTCKANNALGSDSASSFVTVLVPGAPQINVSRVAVRSLDSREPVSIRIGQALSVLSGTKVSIECPVSGVPKPEVTWSRQDNNMDTDGRVLVKDSVLLITNATRADTGLYLCKAVNLAGEVVASSMVNVTKTSLPVISTADRSLQILQSGSFTVDVGSNVTTVARNALSIRCNATGVPTPQIYWSKDGESLDTRGSLYKISSLALSDSGRYQCTASNIDGADYQDIRINVLDGSAPRITGRKINVVSVSGEKEVKIVVGGNITTIVGTKVEIHCPVTALPNATVTWLFNGSTVKKGARRLLKLKNSALSLSGVTPEDTGSYSCLANNSYGEATRTTFLTLIVPVEPKILSSNENVKDFKSVRHELVIGDNLETLEGSTVYVRCPATGNPAPKIQWKKSGGLVPTSSSLRIVNNTLVLLNGAWSDTGTYSCTASNGAGSDEKSTYLNFMAPEKPLIRGDPVDVESYNGRPITVAVGGTLKVLMKTTVNFRCVASGIPKPSVFWNSSSNDMQPANKFDVNQDGRVLTIHDVDTRDSGNYTCSAVNKAGEDTSAAVLEVVEATFPTIASSDASLSWYNRDSRTLPVGGTVEVLSGTEVTLTCKYSAFPEANVKWTVLDEEGDPLPDAGYEIVNGSLLLMALQPSDSAQYVCSVTNVAGTASASTILKVVDPRPPLISSSQDNVVSLSDHTPVEVSAGSVVTVLSGTRVTIRCSAVGTPTPSVVWSRGKELMHTSSTGNMTAAHSSILTIEDASTNDTGDYLCTAMSEVGVDQESTKITVIEPSKPIIRQPEVDKIPLSNDTLVQVSVGGDVTVLTQTRVNVTCEVSGVPNPKITWLKDDKRVESEENSYLVLIIRNVEDAGQVTCHARNLAGNTSLSTNIDVIEPVVPRITSDTGTINALDKRQPVSSSVGMTVQTFTGTSVTLECQTEGSPKPVASWSKNGQPLESKGRVSISGDGTLTIRNTRAQDTGRYKCSAKNAIGETSEASSVYIRSPMSPKIRKSKAYIIWYEQQPFKGKVGDNLTTLKGRKLTLTCPAVGLPKPTITWYRSGMRMKSGKKYLVVGQTLIMYNLDPMDTDRYTCVARNFAGVKTATTTLKVHEPMAPDIMVMYGSDESLEDRRHFNATIGKDISILRGSPLTLKCPVVGVPEPKITWIKDRKMLSSNDRMNTDCIGTLDIYKVELEDSGDYACSAQNFLGMDIAFSSVTVYEAVKPTVEISGRVYVSAGDLVDMHVGDNLTAILTTPVKINCTARGIPRPKMTWKMNGQQLGNGGNYKTDNRGALAIKGVKDPGEFTCIAENFVGQDGASSFISLLDPARPVVITPETTTTIEAKDRSPINMTIGDNLTALTNTSITIQCPTSGVPTPTVTWTKDGEEILNDGRYTVQDDGSLSISEALEEDSAEYTCIADSVTGKDSALSTVKIAEPMKPVIEVTKPGKKIPVGDGSPVTINIGDNVTAASNTTITIRCPVSGIPTPDVTWERDGEQVTPSGRFSISSDSTLVIKEAAVDDSAEYTCSVKSVAGTDSESSTVEIIEPFKPVIKISDKPKTIEAKDRSPIAMTIGDNVTALASTNITIQCSTSGVPIPTVTWAKDGEEIPSDGRYTVQDDSSLLISEAGEEDSGRYTCNAESVAGKNSASSSVKIAGLEKPSILVQKPGPKVPIGDGSPVVSPVGSQITEIAFVRISLTCPTKGSPPPKITWKKDGEELASGDRYVINNEGTLTILQAVLQDTGNYTCSAQNEAGVEEVASFIDILEPLEPLILPPQGSIISDDHKRVTAGVGSKIDALKGATITITCKVKGVPKPTVSWTKDDQDILPDEREVLGSNGTLIIRDSTLEDSGNYTCTASSRIGQTSSTSAVAVSVASKPSIERSEEEMSWEKESLLTVAVGSRVEIINGSSVTLVCNSSGFPSPELTWTRGIEALPSDSNHEISEQSLTIRDVQYVDANEYTCTATNQAGQDAATTELVVKGPGRPVILSRKINITDVDSSKPVVVPIGASVTTIVNATVVITCPNKGSPQPIVTWKHDLRFIVAGTRYQVNDTALIIREVRLDDAGRYECTASNRFGRDVQSLSLDITVPPLISNVKGSFEITDIRDLVSITTGAVVTIPRGVAVRIKCIATGVPSPNITWYRRGEDTNDKSLLVPNENMKIMKDYSLQISHTLVVDAAYYTCVATNIAGQDEGTTHLNIGTPPEIPSYWRGVKSRFTNQARDSRKSSGAVATVVKGANLNIKCPVVGNPKPTIKWIVSTTGRQRRYTVLNDGTLEVPNADLEDEGNYTCIANNSFGTLERTTSVSILVPPEILERHFRHLYDEKRIEGYAMAQMEVKRRTISSLTIEEGYNLILICTVSGKPKPRVTWSRNRVVIKNDTRHLLLPNGVLLVRHVLVKESGRYKCVATNLVGEDQGIVQLTVKDQAKGYWKITDWSKCENCVTHLRGWQERDISCIGPGGEAVSDLHCIHEPKPIKRQRCIHRDCHVIWSASAWSACSRSCGLHGIKLRNVKCVFAKSLKPAKGQCGWQEKPTLQEPCNRKSCTRANCVDRVKYCEKVKKIGMCAVYSRWCCNTCHTA